MFVWPRQIIKIAFFNLSYKHFNDTLLFYALNVVDMLKWIECGGSSSIIFFLLPIISHRNSSNVYRWLICRPHYGSKIFDFFSLEFELYRTETRIVFDLHLKLQYDTHQRYLYTSKWYFSHKQINRVQHQYNFVVKITMRTIDQKGMKKTMLL